MPKPHFIFTKQKNSFVVHVKNLEELSVEQIQNIEEFVKIRKGYFDFETYSFTIYKRVEYYEFVKLLELLHVDVLVEEGALKRESTARISFGKYKGTLFSELPDAYLLWLKKNYIGSDREIISAEVIKRGI